MFYLTKAELYSQRADSERAYALYDSARILLEPRTLPPDSPGYLHGYLGMAYAGIGMKEEAIREAKEAADRVPISSDALSGPYKAQTLAEVYARVGEFEKALDVLEQLLSIRTRLTPSLLRLDPIWDPLQDNPRFRKLLGELA